MLNHSCILAVDEGNRHEHNGKGRNSGKGLDTGAGLRKAGGGTNGLLPANEQGGREGFRQQGQRSHEKRRQRGNLRAGRLCKEHRLNRLVCLEISRLGRNTLEALDFIILC